MTEIPFEILEGKEINSIEFVRDYFQIRFGGPELSVFTKPILKTKTNIFLKNNISFNNELIKCIGRTVEKIVLQENESLSLTFSNQTTIVIPWQDDELSRNEAIIFHVDKNNLFWTW